MAVIIDLADAREREKQLFLGRCVLPDEIIGAIMNAEKAGMGHEEIAYELRLFANWLLFDYASWPRSDR